MAPKPETVSCPKCGQKGNERPGLKLDDYPTLEAVFVGEETIPGLTPQRLTCRACGASWPVLRGSIQVRPA